MNIVTQKLADQIQDRRLREFVSHWDRMEALVINIYRKNYAAAEDEGDYRNLREWIRDDYPHWQDALRAHWQGTRIGGEMIGEDPFLKILAGQDAGAFVDNWGVMQTLPAAREALNDWLLSIIEKSKRSCD